MNREISLYLHIPFCKQKCLYCDFPSSSNKDNLMEEYVLAVSKELDMLSHYKFKTIFIGGGTPTYLSLNSLKELSRAMGKLNLSSNCEFTMECNPKTIDEDKLEVIKAMGVNRISLGVQAWQDSLLKSLGRIHDRKDFLESFELLRKKGIKNINVDLMFGIPNQNLAQWKESLNSIVKLKPEHISCYSLIIEEGTPYYRLFEEGTLTLPEEEEERKMYSFAVNFLKEKAYEQYEISNFSQNGYECKHNLVYWTGEEYIGAGAAAHSFLNNTRYKNTEDICNYIKNIKENKPIKEDKHINTLEDNISEYMFMGLRKTKGISIEEFEKKFNINLKVLFKEKIMKFKNLELLDEKEGRIFLTYKGIELSNTVMCEFIL